jgi:hypothetical protein
MTLDLQVPLPALGLPRRYLLKTHSFSGQSDISNEHPPFLSTKLRIEGLYLLGHTHVTKVSAYYDSFSDYITPITTRLHLTPGFGGSVLSLEPTTACFSIAQPTTLPA